MDADGKLRALVEKWRSWATTPNVTGREALALRQCADELEAALSHVAGPVTDEQIYSALETPLGLDFKLKQLIRGDTVPVGYSKVDVVRALLAALESKDGK